MDAENFFAQHRVAHLATVTREGKPHIVPVCFVFANKQVYIALDEKTKRVGALQLQRVRNIQANPKSQSWWMTIMKIGASWHGRAPMAWRKFCGAVQTTMPPCGGRKKNIQPIGVWTLCATR